MVHPLKSRNRWVVHPTLHCACDHLYVLGLKLNHVSKRTHSRYSADCNVRYDFKTVSFTYQRLKMRFRWSYGAIPTDAEISSIIAWPEEHICKPMIKQGGHLLGIYILYILLSCVERIWRILVFPWCNSGTVTLLSKTGPFAKRDK